MKVEELKALNLTSLPAESVRHHPAQHGPQHAAHDEGGSDDGEENVGGAGVEVQPVVLVVGGVTELSDGGLGGVHHTRVEPEVEHAEHSTQHRPHQQERHAFRHPETVWSL